MKLTTHFIVSSIMTLIFYPLFGHWSWLIFIGGFFIDVDHLYLTWRNTGKWGFKHTYEYCENIAKTNDKEEHLKILKPFHTIEFVSVIVVLSFFYQAAFIILLGMLVHIAMDLYNEGKKFQNFRPFCYIWFAKDAKKHNAK